MQQRVDGSWIDKSLIATYVNTCCTSLSLNPENVPNLWKTVKPLLKVSTEDVLITFVILAVLSLAFKARKKEWNLIDKKARKYLETKGIEKIDALIASVNLPL